jgi:glycosyltransferase involved in cell wall biosynthesis
MSKYKVAVIIPCYNSAKFITKAIDSVLNQDYKYLEIVAIDDGSTDNTRQILESYLPKIRLLFHPNDTNLGQTASLNLGIRETESDLIAFLDSDDLWFTNKITEQVKIFEQNSEFGLVYTNGYVIDENDKKLFPILPADFKEENIPGRILLQCYIKSPSAVIVKRELFQKTKLFKTCFRNAPDHDMWIRMSEVTKFYYIPDFLYAYRKHSNQMTLRRKLWENGFIVLKEACKRYPYGLNLKRKRMAVLYYRLGEYDWKHSNYFHALLNFSLSGILDPFRTLGLISNKITKLFM